MMASDSAQPDAHEPKPESPPHPQDDLKSLPLPEVEERLGSSPDGLTQVEAQLRLAQCGHFGLTLIWPSSAW